MKKHHLFILLSFWAGVVFWIIDANIDTSVRGGGTLLNLSLYTTSWPDIFERSWAIAMFTIFGIMVSRYLGDLEKTKQKINDAYYELKYVFDSSPDALIYIASDNKIMRFNEKAEEFLGIPAVEAIGKPCKNIFGIAICSAPNCPLTLIRNGQERYEREFSLTGADGVTRDYFLTATPCRTDDGELLGIVKNIRDVTERKAISRKLYHLLELERTLAECSTRLIHIKPDEIDNEIYKTIETIGTFSGVDRSYIFLFRDNMTIMDNTHEWCAEGISPQIDTLQGIPVSELPVWMEYLTSFRTIHIPRLSELSDDWEMEKPVLERQGIQSLLVVPMAYRNNLVGFLGFDAVRGEKSWMPEDMRLLNMAAEIITNALMRKRDDMEMHVLSEKRAELETIINRSPAVAFLWKMEDGWPVEFVSDNVSQFGYTAEELRSDNFKFADIVHSDDLDRVAEEVAVHLSSPDTVDFHQEYRIVTPDGGYRWVDDRSWVRRDKYGVITYIQGVLVDITERREAEAAREFEHRQLLSIFDSIDEAIYVADPKTHEVLYVNRFLRDLLPEDPIGGVCYRMFQNFDTPCSFCTNEKILADKNSVHQWEFYNKMLDRHFIVLDRIIMWPDGRDVRFEMAVDVSDLKKAEERMSLLVNELETKNRELEDFAYVVSHDLKAPLRAIGTLAEWIATDNADKLDDDGKEHLSLLMSRVKRMHDLIEGVLKYSRLGRIREEMEIVDINEEIATVIDMLAPPETFTIEIENKLPSIVAEKTRIRQIFENLISNAIKFNDKPEGIIRIGCSSDDGMWMFRVSDNGPGIDEKYHDKIFKIFQTLQARDEFESTGIGLTLVKKIVTMYGGSVWVESKRGIGSTFVFTLPTTVTTAGVFS